MQVIICLLILAVFFGIILVLYFRNLKKNLNKVERERNHYSLDELTDYVIKCLADFLRADITNARTDEEYKTAIENKNKIENAMINCVYGIDVDKILVKGLIASYIKDKCPDIESLNRVFGFDNLILSGHVMFELLMQRLEPMYGKNALSYLIQKYNWDRVRYNIEDGTVPSYNISKAELEEAYTQEIIDAFTYSELLEVGATLIYENYKGMGIIDTLRTMNIDGFNIGTSGFIMSKGDLADANGETWDASRSVWIYYRGKYIHLQFLQFSSPEEVRRVVQLIARYNNPGPLTEKRGYLVSTMYDKSRVLALRPNASEYWACFVRKFVLSSHTLEALINPVKLDGLGNPLTDSSGNVIYKYKNAELAINTIKLLMRGQVTTGFTGRQGSGKTTMMTAAISQVDGRFNLRVLEMAPEMYLRELYPQRNILSLAETPTVGATELQDALKKSDAALSIVGEVATDPIAARMIQMGQVASIFTIFSHHANRTVDLVNAITNSIVAASGGSATPATVQPQVIDVIKVDAHLDYDVNGNRYIERITEIIRLDAKPYPEMRKGERLDAYKIRLDKEYYTRQTDRETFTTRDVLRFNPHTFTYDVARDENGKPVFFSPELTKHIFSRLPVEEVKEWKKFVLDYWYKDVLKERGSV